MRVDLHAHTSASDGSLTPAQLCQRAVDRAVRLLAITDHDTAQGYREARDWLAGQALPLQLVSGAEFSCVWSGVAVHVVGLGIDVDSPSAREAFEHLQGARLRRAELIGERLAKLGMPGACEGARELAGPSQVGRPHFARFLVQAGHVASEDIAFERYLGAGKVGDVKALWPELAEVVAWIRGAGGVAVLAHPLKYRLTAAKLKRLVQAFVAAGGEALEVVTGRQQADGTQLLARLCSEYGLQASAGSDFHGPGYAWSELGDMSALPATCAPVWRRWV